MEKTSEDTTIATGDGGWYDAEGNYCYADNTYYDPQGVYRNADGSIYVAAPEVTKQESKDDWSDEGDEGWGRMMSAETALQEELKAAIRKPEKKADPWTVLNYDELKIRLDNMVEEIASSLSLPPAQVDLLLRYFHYDTKKTDKFLLDMKFQNKTREESGMYLREPDVPVSGSKHMCGAYCEDDPLPLSEIHALTCGHYFCHDCWAGNLNSQLGSGVIMFSSCPGLNESTGKRCKEPVDFATCQKYLSQADAKRLQNWIIENFVKESRLIKWCPNPRCQKAVEYTEGGQIDVICTCMKSFCFSCTLEPHAPMPCDLAVKWIHDCDKGGMYQIFFDLIIFMSPYSNHANVCLIQRMPVLRIGSIG